MFDCIILLAGKGKRTNLPFNKIKYNINGKAIYEYSLSTFLKIKECDKIILVCAKEDYDDFKKLESEKIVVCTGGEERQNSVYNGLLHVTCDYVMIHDGARPNIKEEEILKLYDAMQKYGVASLATCVKNAVKKVKDNFVVENVDRSDLYLMQTPQGMKTNLIKEALEKVNKLVYDDIEAVEDVFNIHAYIVEGREDNIKFTTSEDIKYLQYLLKE